MKTLTLSQIPIRAPAEIALALVVPPERRWRFVGIAQQPLSLDALRKRTFVKGSDNSLSKCYRELDSTFPGLKAREK